MSAPMSAIVRELIAAGVQGEGLVAALERIEQAATPVRSSAAVRQARYRERKRDESVTRDVTHNESNTPFPTPLTQNPTPFSPLIGDSFPLPSKHPSPAEPLGFDQFWDAYPAKVGKGAARKAYPRAAAKIHAPDKPAVMIAAIDRQKRSRRWQEGIIPNPATWLNEERWTDGEPGATKPQAPPGPVTAEAQAKRLRHHRDTGEWFPAWGPPPEPEKQSA